MFKAGISSIPHHCDSFQGECESFLTQIVFKLAKLPALLLCANCGVNLKIWKNPARFCLILANQGLKLSDCAHAVTERRLRRRKLKEPSFDAK